MIRQSSGFFYTSKRITFGKALNHGHPMFLKTATFLSVFIFSSFHSNLHSSNEIKTNGAVEEISENFVENSIIKNFSPEGHISPTRYDVYSSEEKEFIYFRVFKAATGTLTHFFTNHVQDLTHSRPSTVSKKMRKYFKFAFVRNTFERLVSVYFHIVLDREEPEFSPCFGKDFDFFVDFISKLDLTTADRHVRLQTRLFPYKECDFIGTINNFESDLQHICDKLGLEMEKIGHRHQTEHAHYSTYYTPRTKKIISKKYKEEIEAFKFKFETE